MSVFTELARRQQRQIFILEIDGLEDCFFSSDQPPTLPNYGTAWSHVAKRGIIGVSPAAQTLDPLKSTAEAGQVAVTLAITGRGGSNEALQLLARDSAAQYTATLAETVEQNSASFVTVNEDISNWPASGVLWIGQEAIQYSARSVVAPFRFTVPVISSRGWFGSEQRRHLADPITGLAPRVYSQCVAWQGRKARVLVTAARHNGTHPDEWVEYVSGRIIAPPEGSDDGLQIAINIMPHTNALKQEIGGATLRTGLQQGYHTFDGLGADRFMLQVGYAAGQAWKENVTFASAAGAAVSCRWRAHKDAFDIATGGTGSRGGTVTIDEIPNTPFAVTGYNGTARGAAPADSMTLDPATGVAVPANAIIQNAPAWDQINVTPLTTPGTAEVVGWPNDALAKMNADMSPGDVVGVNGRFSDVSIDPNHPNGPSLVFRPNTDATTQTVRLTAWESNFNRLYYGIGLFAPENTARISDLEGGGAASGINRTIQSSGEEDLDSLTGPQSYAVAIRGVADAYYQKGERYIHVADDVIAADSRIRLRWTEHDGTERRWAMGISTVQTAATITPGSPGHLLEVPENERAQSLSFGDWPGQVRCTIEQDVSWSHADPATVLLQILMSGDGLGFNSSSDVFPRGANLTTDEIDVDSFYRFPYPDGLATDLSFSLNDIDSSPIEQVIEPILKAIGGALVLRVEQTASTGGIYRRKLTLVSLGSEYAGDSIKTITNGLWLAERRPTPSEDERLVNRITVLVNYSPSEDEHRLSISVRDQDSIGENGASSIEEIDLRGVTVDAQSPTDQVRAVLPFTAQRFSNLGKSRRQVTGNISWADALLLNAGSTVLVSATNVANYDGTMGVVNQAMRVISIEPSPYKQDAQVKLTWHDRTLSGVAPSLKVTSVVSSSIYVVAANGYTEAVSPVDDSAQTDISFWNVGDSVRACPRGNYANSTAGLTVTDITGNQITLSAAASPALVVGDTLRGDDYTAAATTEAQKGYQHPADDAATLGAGDAAKIYG